MPDARSPRRGRGLTVRARLTLLYAALICSSVVVSLGVVYLLLSGSSWQRAPGQVRQGGIMAAGGHSPALLAPFAAAERTAGLAVALGVVAVVSVALGWLVAGRFVRPLRTIIATAQDISATNLHRRLGLRGRRDEFTELGGTLDDLFARLEASFEAQRHFIANASHELRTPLSAGRALLQLAITDPAPTVESLRATCEELVELGDRQERLIAALLTLASSQRGLHRSQPLDLAELAARALAAREAEADRRGIRLDVALGPAPATGDPSLVESLMANLLDNAVRHNVPGGQVEIITGRTAAGAARLAVGNTGPVIAADAVDSLFQPFRRLGAERIRPGEQDGYGLGLAIVRAIAGAHGATLLARARSEGGLHIEVTFPA
ncbi:HAMP domain-containing sensor histidine kinase [Nonomuraea sp. NPDC049607]|uniref:sensor histidine kinase n=1 Tax=Nonomuraea sp. NPDC049607 TaxID=3154732 RepID=UPI00341BE1FB